MVTRPHTATSAPIGAYALEVGMHVSSFAQFASTSSRPERSLAKKNAAALRSALVEPDEEHQSHTPLEAAEEFENKADAVTDRVEHANKVFRAVSDGLLVDPNLITGEIGALLGLLDRLDREGRYDEEIRVAKALHGLCVLAFRWLDLVRSLRAALAAARAAGDEAGQAWALNESGALHLCAGNGNKAAECLEQALELQETIGDAAGRCATRHNRDSARRDVARPIQLAAPRRLLNPGGMVRSLLLASMLAVAVLTGLGATAVADMLGNGDDHGAGPLVVTIDHRPPNPSASSTATFSFSAEGANAFECELDKRDFEGCQSPAQYTDLKAGEHTFRVRATAQGQKGPTAKEVWRVDLRAPTTTITAKPAARATETSAAFQFEANEEVQSFQCRLGDELFTACASPRNIPGPLAEGTHVFAVRAIDLAGNVGEVDRDRWTISPSGKTAVPNIVGMQLARGIDALENTGLRWEKREITSTKPVGQIVSQDPRAREEVPVETTVEFGVSVGIGTVAVPNLVGLASSSALAELERAGLHGNIVQANSNSMPEGQVLKQNPDPGTEVARGSTVDITISMRSSLPDLTVTIPTDGVQVACPTGARSCVTTVTFTVTNEGKGAAKENVEVLVSADPGETRAVTLRAGLAAGASTIRTTRLGPGGNCYDPDCSVQVTADPLGRVSERNEQNNAAQWTRNG